jgi:hypothetical protein
MRTFIGLPFTWLPNRVRPDQVLVPFVPTSPNFDVLLLKSSFDSLLINCDSVQIL